MKVTDLRRKLMAALAAGGLLAPSAMYAANLNTDLVVNGDFENVDTVNAPFGTYNAPRSSIGSARAWPTPTTEVLQRRHGRAPNYANGAAPPNSGHWYFTPNASTPDSRIPASSTRTSMFRPAPRPAPFQRIRWLQFECLYEHLFDDLDFGNSQLVEFPQQLGSKSRHGVDVRQRCGDQQCLVLNTKTGVIPIGTKTVRLSAYGTAVNGGPDGYIDNVDFQVSVVTLPALRITVNRANGSITLSNDTGAAVNLSGYSITSAFEGAGAGSWLSIADNYDNGNPGPNQVDAAHSWSKLTSRRHTR